MNKHGHRFRLSRRSMLMGAGGMALGLPLLDVMREPRRTLAQSVPGYTAAGHPKRFIAWFTPNGTIPMNWTPGGSGTEFTFSNILSPLEPYRHKLLLIDGVDQTGGRGGDAHQSGMQGALTGWYCNPGHFMGGDGFSAGWANGPSVDQRIADVIGQETPFRSLEFAVQPGENEETNYNRMCLRGPDQPVPSMRNPYDAYERLFAGGVSTGADGKLQNERQRRVLDAVHGNLTRLKARLGKSDRLKLEQHAEHVHEIEVRLSKRPAAALDACKTPVLAGDVDVERNENFPVVGRLQMDLLVMAMACDLTRVSSLQWNKAVGQVGYSWVDPTINRGHHDLSHDGDSNEVTLRQLTDVNRWYAEQLAYLLGQLDGIAEGDGTMLDNTVVFCVNELAKGNSHSLENSHFVVAGGADYFRMGRCLKYDHATGPKHNDLLLSLVHSMGIEDTSFGNPEWCTGPLSGMTG
jgi:hypothetical protein